MCWEMDYEYFAEQEKAKKAKMAQDKRSGVISDLLADANKQAEKTGADATPASEVLPAK